MSGITKKTYICNICGYIVSTYEIYNYICQRCGHLADVKIKLHVDNIVESYETHQHVSWFCRECEHKGLTWLKRDGSSRLSCPHCKAEPNFVRLRAIDPQRGACRNMWESFDSDFF